MRSEQPKTTDGFTIRDATPSDAPAIAAVHVQAFNETHGVPPGGGPTIQLREYQWAELFKQADKNWFCFVIENNAGQLVGFARALPYKDENLPYDGQLNKIYILRSHHKFGLGRQLLCAVANRFLALDIHSMLLFGEAANPSNGFYERMGAEKLYAANGDFHGGYGWKDLHLLAFNLQ